MERKETFSLDWMERFKMVINTDPELSWVGRFMNLRFIWRIEEVQYLFVVKNGKVESVSSPTWNDSWDFELSGPVSAWEKFVQPVPPPMYNDVLGMVSKLPDCDLTGNRLVAMQNIRALTTMMNLARRVSA
jgi:hypothetical protein